MPTPIIRREHDQIVPIGSSAIRAAKGMASRTHTQSHELAARSDAMAVAGKKVTWHSKPIDLLDFSGMAVLITGAAPGTGRAYVSGEVHIAEEAMTARGMFPTDTMAAY